MATSVVLGPVDTGLDEDLLVLNRASSEVSTCDIRENTDASLSLCLSLPLTIPACPHSTSNGLITLPSSQATVVLSLYNLSSRARANASDQTMADLFDAGYTKEQVLNALRQLPVVRTILHVSEARQEEGASED